MTLRDQIKGVRAEFAPQDPYLPEKTVPEPTLIFWLTLLAFGEAAVLLTIWYVKG